MAFATTADVETRLGRSLTTAEEAMAEQVIDTVTELIVEIAGKAEEDLTASYFQALCIDKVLLIGANPNGLASESETLGDHTYSKTFPRNSDDGLFLTEREEHTVRRIANNAVSGSSRPRALPHDTYVTEDA